MTDAQNAELLGLLQGRVDLHRHMTMLKAANANCPDCEGILEMIVAKSTEVGALIEGST